jgi:hypothetical protein
MTALLPELERLPLGLTLDGELVAFRDGLSDFPLLCEADASPSPRRRGHLPRRHGLELEAIRSRQERTRARVS